MGYALDGWCTVIIAVIIIADNRNIFSAVHLKSLRQKRYLLAAVSDGKAVVADTVDAYLVNIEG